MREDLLQEGGRGGGELTVTNKRYYYKASSASAQDGAILPARDYPLYPASKISPKVI